MADAAEIQRQYYTATAASYEQLHMGEQGEHDAALRFISSLVAQFDLRSLLDVGCGTGRGVKYFLEHHPALHVRGVEPVRALLDRAVHTHGIPRSMIDCGMGQSLPYGDASFDAVCAFGILHHVADPDAVVREMLRVARAAVFISDGNRFGQGSWFGRITKLALYRMRLWPLANYLKTRGRGYTITAGDGLAYSYSVFDSFDRLAAWAEQVLLIPTGSATATSWYHPLLTTPSVLACAVRQPVSGGRADWLRSPLRQSSTDRP